MLIVVQVQLGCGLLLMLRKYEALSPLKKPLLTLEIMPKIMASIMQVSMKGMQRNYYHAGSRMATLLMSLSLIHHALD
ncbi:hypothetical protein D3C75_1196420 [compost metagenome]